MKRQESRGKAHRCRCRQRRYLYPFNKEEAPMAEETADQLRKKLEQAHQVIVHLMDKAACSGTEAYRALSYFAGSDFDDDFLPWPRRDDEGLRPDELSAANDD
jgi:hypothetical protein